MKEIKMRQDRSMVLTVTLDPTKVVRGHISLSGAGTHTDKRHRRTTRKSRNERAIAEWR